MRMEMDSFSARATPLTPASRQAIITMVISFKKAFFMLKKALLSGNFKFIIPPECYRNGYILKKFPEKSTKTIEKQNFFIFSGQKPSEGFMLLLSGPMR